MSALFTESSLTLLACWTLGPNYRVTHDRNKTNKITYTVRLIIVTEGEVLFKSGGKDLKTGPGTLLYLPPACLYDTDFQTDELTSQNLFFDFDSERVSLKNFTTSFTQIIPAASTADVTLIQSFPGFSDAPELSYPFTVQSDSNIDKLIYTILAEVTSRAPFTEKRTSVLSTDLLIQILRKKRGGDETRTSETYRRIVDYVEAYLSEKLSGRELAEALNYHPNYMNHVVSKMAGMNLHEFIIQTKLKRAEYLLIGTDLSIADIAQSLAFYDSGHFARVFASRKGITPNVFRNTSRRL